MSPLIEDILSHVDIIDIVSGYVKLKRAGKNFLWLCPFHNEKSPSFTVAPDKQIFKCFGCGQGGNVITFVQEIERVDFREASKILCKFANLDITKYQNKSNQYEAKTTEKEKIKLINQYALWFFQQHLQSSQTALNYIKNKRKLSDTDIIERHIGYAPEQYESLINHLIQQWFTQEDIIQSGLGKIGSNGYLYSMFRNRIMFAINDHIGNIVWFAGRSIDPEDMPKYLNISETLLYNKSNILYGLDRAKQYITQLKHLVIVEWYMDVIGLNKFGIPIGVATCGTSLTTNHIKLLKRYGATIICAFDNDTAWFNAMIRSLGMFYEHDIYPKVLILPQNIKDIDEWQRSESAINNGKISIETFLNHTMEWFQVVLQRLLELHDHTNPTQRKLVINQIFELLKFVADYSVIMLYITQMSQTLSIDQTLLFNQYKKHLKGQTLRTLPIVSKKIAEYHEDVLIASLIFEKALQNITTDTHIHKIFWLILTMLDHIPQHPVHGILSEKTTDLLTAQMRRDKQLAYQDDTKKTQYLNSFLLWYTQWLIKKIMKSDIQQTTKHDFMKQFQMILKPQ
jgi:DNA primase